MRVLAIALAAALLALPAVTPARATSGAQAAHSAQTATTDFAAKKKPAKKKMAKKTMKKKKKRAKVEYMRAVPSTPTK